MKKALQKAKELSLRVVALFGTLARFGGRGWAAGCGACFGDSPEVARAAGAGAILFGIAGAGIAARGAVDRYVAPSAAGATLTIGWGYLWLLTGVLGAIAGTAIGAGVTFLSRLRSPQRGAAIALLIVGAVGGTFAGGTWGMAVARERVFKVQAQPASRPPVAVRNGSRLDVVSGQVRLSGGIVRELNGTLVSFMIAAGAVVGLLAARGMNVQQPRGAGAPAPQGTRAQRQGRNAYPAGTPATA